MNTNTNMNSNLSIYIPIHSLRNLIAFTFRNEYLPVLDVYQINRFIPNRFNKYISKNPISFIDFFESNLDKLVYNKAIYKYINQSSTKNNNVSINSLLDLLKGIQYNYYTSHNFLKHDFKDLRIHTIYVFKYRDEVLYTIPYFNPYTVDIQHLYIFSLEDLYELYELITKISIDKDVMNQLRPVQQVANLILKSLSKSLSEPLLNSLSNEIDDINKSNQYESNKYEQILREILSYLASQDINKTVLTQHVQIYTTTQYIIEVHIATNNIDNCILFINRFTGRLQIYIIETIKDVTNALINNGINGKVQLEIEAYCAMSKIINMST